jgi:formyl-CoA transferase
MNDARPERRPETNAAASDDLPLRGIRVLDLTLARAGPTCVRHLADWGAEVIRIEPPPMGEQGDITGNRDGFDFQNLHRNKRAMQLDLKSEAGKQIFRELVMQADVIVENMRARVKYRLGVDYDSVSKINPRIVYGSISGFGQDGPYGHRAGVDQIAQGMGGLMSITGAPGDGPMRVGIPICDLTAGNLLALGIMMGLFQRHTTGRGRWVHTSLLEVMVFMLDFQATRWLMAGEVASQAGNDHPTAIPTGVFPTADRAITLAASSARHWTRFCAALGRPEWAEKPEWASGEGRSANRAEINAAIASETSKHSALHWMEVMDEAGIPCGPINSIDQTFADPQVQHLDMAKPVQHPRLGTQRIVGSAINMAGLDDSPRSATAEAGADTDSILAGLGRTPEQIAELRAQRVI